MRKLLPTLFASLLLLGSCSSTTVHSDYDPEYDFTGKLTYAWAEGVPAQSELNQKRIVKSVDEALAAKGLRQSTPPDLWVSTQVLTQQEVRSSGGNVGIGIGGYSGGGSVGVGMSSPTRTYEVTVGTLIIEIRDGSSEQVVWRASAKETVTEDAENAQASIAKAVQKAFEDFPPQRR